MTTRSTTTLPGFRRGQPRTIFALLNPDGVCVSVIDAADIDDAKFAAQIPMGAYANEIRKRPGWRVVPATLTWEEGE